MREKLESKLQAGAGGFGVISNTNQYAGAYAPRVRSDSAIGKLAGILSSVNPILKQLTFESQEDSIQDATLKAQTAFEELEAENQNYENIQKLSMKMLEDGQIRKSQLPTVQRNFKTRLGESLADSYRLKLSARMDEVASVVNPKAIPDVYSELAEEMNLPDDFWVQASYQNSIARYQREFEDLAARKQDANFQKEAAINRRESSYKVFDAIAQGQTGDLKAYVKANYDSEMFRGEAQEIMLSDAKSYLSGLLKNPDNYQEAQTVLDTLSELNLSGNGELGNTGLFRSNFSDIQAQIDEYELDAPNRQIRRDNALASRVNLSVERAFAEVEDFENVDPVTMAEEIINNIESTEGQLPDWMKSKNGHIYRTAQRLYDNHLAGGAPNAFNNALALVRLGKTERADEVFEASRDFMSPAQLAEFEAARTNEEQLNQFVNDRSLASYFYRNEEGVVLDSYIAGGMYPPIPDSLDPGTAEEVNLAWSEMSGDEKIQLMRGLQDSVTKDVRDRLRAFETPQERQANSERVLLEAGKKFREDAAKLINDKYFEIGQQRLLEKSLVNTTFASRAKLPTPRDDFEFTPDSLRIRTGGTAIRGYNYADINSLEELGSLVEANPRFDLKGDEPGEIDRVPAEDVFFRSKAVLGYTAEEIMNQEANGVSFIASEVNSHYIPVFKDVNELNDFVDTYTESGDMRLLTHVHALGFTEKDIPEFVAAQRKILAERANSPTYIRLKKLFNGSKGTEQADTSASQSE